MKSFKDLAVEAEEENRELLEKHTKGLIKTTAKMIRMRQGFIRRREDEIQEIKQLEAKIEKAYEENKPRKLEMIADELETFDERNRGRSRNYT